MDFDAWLDQASPRETGVPLCLDGKLVRAYEELKDRIDERAAKRAAVNGQVVDDRLSSKSPDEVPDPEQPELDRLAAQLQARTQVFTVRALPRQEFQDLLAKYPPRVDGKTGRVDPRDIRAGVRPEFFPVFVKASVVDPDLSIGDRWEKLNAVLSDAQFNKLAAAAWDLNQTDADVPFSLSGSPSPLPSDGS